MLPSPNLGLTIPGGEKGTEQHTAETIMGEAAGHSGAALTSRSLVDRSLGRSSESGSDWHDEQGSVGGDGTSGGNAKQLLTSDHPLASMHGPPVGIHRVPKHAAGWAMPLQPDICHRLPDVG